MTVLAVDADSSGVAALVRMVIRHQCDK
jgi:hypothetical protein